MRDARWVVALAVVGVLAPAGAARAADEAAVKAAIARGVEALRKAQLPNGTWPRAEAANRQETDGATALAALTLLECGAGPDDPAVAKAAGYLRRQAVTMQFTYALSLTILFLDRLGDPGDVPLIESLAVRLMAGQNAGGGWTYNCPEPPPGELGRLSALAGRRGPPAERREEPEPTGRRRTARDLPPEIRQQLEGLARRPALSLAMGGDNSNTQFATLALWVARRHGLPTDDALRLIAARYRASQTADFGWNYTSNSGPSSPTMTCAGLLGVAVERGVAVDHGKGKGPDGKDRPGPNLDKDPAVVNALRNLGAYLSVPAKDIPPGLLPSPRVNYFLWSLERVAVALSLDTIGKTNWYDWGAAVLLPSQTANGTWDSGGSNAVPDTCFALLFLKRANLASDLTNNLRGRIRDPGRHELKGRLPGDLRGPGDVGDAPAPEPARGGAARPPEPRGPTAAPAPRTAGGAGEAAGFTDRLRDQLLRAPADRLDAAVEKLRDGKGNAYTDALAAAIPLLDEAGRRKAREALAERLARLTADNVGDYLKSDDPELRRAAALACAMKETRAQVPRLIELLRDPEPVVARAAHASLKALAGGKDLGRDPDAWQAWWEKSRDAARP
jgi:hypothetical protein